MKPRLEVLTSQKEVDAAHSRQRALGLCDSPTGAKTWDNVLAVEDLVDVARALPVLDVGCRSGILLVWLNQLGFRQLFGVDRRRPLPPLRSALEQARLRTAVACVQTWAAHRTRLGLASAEELPYSDAQFAAVASMSVIEHGVNRTKFLQEANRILKPGGRLIISTDFWYEPTATKAHLFGQPDSILSPADVTEFLSYAREEGFEVPDSAPLAKNHHVPVIDFEGSRYTFLYMSLLKTGGQSADSEAGSGSLEKIRLPYS